jgi:nucleoside-diphosphate-sugar epimerase
MMRVFVTGGSGFVGQHLVEHLVASGHQVSALARSEASVALVRAAGATAITADLANVQPAQLDGHEALIHCAAFASEWGSRAQFVEGNVTGTERMLAAAQVAQVPRFVHVGTEAAMFNGAPLVDIDESAPYARPQRYLYSETKAEAERRVLAANRPGFLTVSIRPRLVWGPRDTTVLPVVLRLAKSGRWRWLDHGEYRTSTTHVANAVHALELALRAGRGGEAYFVADDGTRTLREFLTALAKTRGVELPSASMPSALARPVATAVEALWHLVSAKRAPPMTAMAVAMMSATVTVKTTKARRELGYLPRVSVEEGLQRLNASSPG